MAGATPGPDDTLDRDVAMQRVFDREWAPMVRLATLLLGGDRRRAEEVVQDALLGLHRMWDRLDEPHQAAGYLRRSVVNGCRSVHRRTTLERRHLGLVARGEVWPGDTERESVDHDVVIRLLRTLPVRQREVLVLRYWSDASEADIARTLGISTGAVKTHASRGLAAVRASLTPPQGVSGA